MGRISQRLSMTLFLLSLAAYPATAELYSWTDEKGVKHFSTVPRECITEGGTVLPKCRPDPAITAVPKEAREQPAPEAAPPAKPKAPPGVQRRVPEVAGSGEGLAWPWYVGGAILFALYVLRKFRFRSREVVYVEGPGEFDQEIVGESHYQRELKAICGGRTREGHRKAVRAMLILEDDNKHDPNAVRVEVQGCTVGYLTREDAQTYRRRIARAGKPDIVIECDAIIVGGWSRGLFDKGHFGVYIDLPVDEV